MLALGFTAEKQQNGRVSWGPICWPPGRSAHWLNPLMMISEKGSPTSSFLLFIPRCSPAKNLHFGSLIYSVIVSEFLRVSVRKKPSHLAITSVPSLSPSQPLSIFLSFPLFLWLFNQQVSSSSICNYVYKEIPRKPKLPHTFGHVFISCTSEFSQGLIWPVV